MTLRFFKKKKKTRIERRKKNNMNRKICLNYLKQKEFASDTNNEKEITVTKIVTSSTNDTFRIQS